LLDAEVNTCYISLIETGKRPLLIKLNSSTLSPGAHERYLCIQQWNILQAADIVTKQNLQHK